MKKVYKIISCITDVYEDSYEHGEGEHVNAWYGTDVVSQMYAKEFDSLRELLVFLNDKYLYVWKDKNKIDNWYLFDEDYREPGEVRFNNVMTVDRDNNPADGRDIECWKENRLPLYNAHTDLLVRVEFKEPVGFDEILGEIKAEGIEEC